MWGVSHECESRLQLYINNVCTCELKETSILSFPAPEYRFSEDHSTIVGIGWGVENGLKE